jgi:hypothetical protein
MGAGPAAYQPGNLFAADHVPQPGAVAAAEQAAISGACAKAICPSRYRGSSVFPKSLEPIRRQQRRRSSRFPEVPNATPNQHRNFIGQLGAEAFKTSLVPL